MWGVEMLKCFVRCVSVVMMLFVMVCYGDYQKVYVDLDDFVLMDVIFIVLQLQQDVDYFFKCVVELYFDLDVWLLLVECEMLCFVLCGQVCEDMDCCVFQWLVGIVIEVFCDGYVGVFYFYLEFNCFSVGGGIVFLMMVISCDGVLYVKYDFLLIMLLVVGICLLVINGVLVQEMFVMMVCYMCGES